MALKKSNSSPSVREFFEEDDEYLERDAHGDMARIYLIEPLRVCFQRIGFQAYVSGNSAVFYDRWQNPISPDVYVVNGGEQRGQNSWAVKEEGGLTPTFVMEFLSKKTEKHDRGKKMLIYRDVIKAPDYFMLDRRDRLEGYRLEAGVYVPVEPDQYGRLHLVSLDLSMGMVDGNPRWFDRNGKMLLSGREEAEQIRLQSIENRQRAERAEEELARLREELRRRP